MDISSNTIRNTITFGTHTVTCDDVSTLRNIAKQIDINKNDLSDQEIDEIKAALDNNKGNIAKAEECLRNQVLQNEWSLERMAEFKGMKLEKFMEITDLDLTGSRITDLSHLKELKNLKALKLDGLKITDLSVLCDLKGLETLSLDQTNVSDLTPLKELKKLRALDLNLTLVTDITTLKYLKDLETLGLDLTKISDLTPLKNLKNMQHLYLAFTNITEVTALKGMKKLSDVDLSGTKITKEQKDDMFKALPNCSIYLGR